MNAKIIASTMLRCTSLFPPQHEVAHTAPGATLPPDAALPQAKDHQAQANPTLAPQVGDRLVVTLSASMQRHRGRERCIASALDMRNGS